MKCPACNREQPMSFRCRFCGNDLVRQSAPPRSATAPPARSPSARGETADAGVNPYAAPAARNDAYPVQGRDVHADLANPGTRLLAQLLDGLLGLVCIGPGMALVLAGTPSEPGGDLSAVGVIGVVLVLIGLLGLVIYQIRLLAREGQTWGKAKMNIRIVLYDTDDIPGLGRSLGLRLFVNNLIGSIPCVGPFYTLTDILFIFSAEHRCLHDRIAGTKVVQVA